ncbi:unnamed protein product [Caenorhabditis auriculariae]|uniref:Uncharacterized protein n=1 Tax=Caenorhabditis auriculariae TaxID=2777116 RepID=A0A8S1H108_9PELO|nr:unnamed protein product [Caenorhabditis auriculariae]
MVRWVMSSSMAARPYLDISQQCDRPGWTPKPPESCFSSQEGGSGVKAKQLSETTQPRDFPNTVLTYKLSGYTVSAHCWIGGSGVKAKFSGVRQTELSWWDYSYGYVVDDFRLQAQGRRFPAPEQRPTLRFIEGGAPQLISTIRTRRNHYGDESDNRSKSRRPNSGKTPSTFALMDANASKMRKIFSSTCA